jgi:hypothetical protein
MSQFKTTTIEDTEMIYSLLRDKYPDRQIEIEFNDNTKEYFLKLTNEKFKEDPEVPVDIKIKIIYGDSVTGDTPVLLKKDDNIYIETIQSIFEESKKFEYPGFKLFDKTIRLEKEYCLSDYQIWSDIGWVDIKKVIRHKTDKKIYNVLTHNGFVKVTEDHSLLNENGDIIKPSECNLETKLLSNYPTQFDCNIETISKDRAYIYGFFYGDGDIETEEWKIINEYPDYSASTFGNIKNNKSNKILKVQNNGDYLVVSLKKDLNSYTKRVHRLIAHTFLNNPDNKDTVNHKNHNTKDNCLENLEWYTMTEQNIHKNTNMKNVHGKYVIQYDLNMNYINTFNSANEAMRITQIPASSIIYNCNGFNDNCHGFIWKYKNTIELKNEIWKDIEINNITFTVSNKGRVKSKKGIISYGSKENTGYYRVKSCTTNNGIQKSERISVHILVAKAFINNTDLTKNIVNHIDGNKENNYVENLEWVTQKENMIHYQTNNKKTYQKINQDEYLNEKITLNNSDLNIIENLKQLLTKEYPEHTPIVYDTIESSGVYKLSVNNQKLFVEEYRSKFYDSDRYKKVPSEILNSSLEVVQSFFEGYKLTSDFENNFSEDDEDDDDEDEEWRVIKEFPQYLASSLGNIKHIETNKLRTLKANNGGYITIGINNNDNIRKQVKVHRLIADTFLDNVENKETVNHINHNKLDNRVKNLEWATTKEQNNHKSHNQINSNNSKKVLQYDLDGNFIKEYNSIKEIGRIFNKNPGDISKICNNLKGFKTFEGYTWKFKDEDNILENEIWKTIKIDNHIFNVSNFGRVKSKNNIISYGSLSTNGYMRVTSQEDKVSKRMYVHRLVATTFIENKLNNKDQVVNHMDGNKQNNNVNNLEWITYQENSKHSFDLKATDGCRKDKEKIGCTRFDNKGQIGSAGLYYLMRKLGYNVSINTREDKEKILRLTITQKQQRKIPNQIKKIKISNHDSYVYDIETECGRFQAGVGDIIVKNTDSIFISLKYNREEFNKNRADTFNLATICGENITKMFNRNPIDLEFEKVFQPFILLTKKRYIGKKYENMKDPFKLKEITKSGIAITRRDYCKMVKNCYTEVIDCIVNEDGGGVNNSVEIYKSYVDRIDNYQIDIDDLIVSAMLAKSYKTRPVHVQLAEKLKARHEEVQVGSRIPYIFIESADKTLAKSELGEDPIYAKKHNLKYNRKCYLEQMAKPLLGFFKCVLSDNEEALDDIINYTNEKLVEYGGAKLKPSDFKMKEDD